jgi:hypothetical protein
MSNDPLAQAMMSELLAELERRKPRTDGNVSKQLCVEVLSEFINEQKSKYMKIPSQYSDDPGRATQVGDYARRNLFIV